jgi:hypothetical protein
MMSGDDVAAFPFETVPPPPYNPSLGRWLTLVGAAIVVISLLLPALAWHAAYGPFLQINADDPNAIVLVAWIPLVSFAFCLFGVSFGVSLIGRGRRLQAPPALELLRRDRRAPVLFLRFFDDDDLIDPAPRMVPLGDLFPRRYEESLALALKGIGPMITIGRPGDTLAMLGGGRVCVPDHVWKDAVDYLRARASAIVLVVGRSQGIWWEITSSLESVPVERLLFFFPYVEETKRRRSFVQRALHFRPANLPLWRGAYRRMEQERAKRYAAFRERMPPLVARALPPTLDDSQFIDFIEDGTPRVLKRVRPWWWPVAVLVPSMRRMLADHRRTLQPFREKFRDASTA